MNINDILKILQRDKIRNANLIHFVQAYPIERIHVAGDSVLIQGKSDQSWIYISSQSKQEFRMVLNYLTDEDQYFAIIEAWMIPMLIKGKDIIWKLSCVKLYFPEGISLPETKYSIAQLSVEEAGYIYENYQYKAYTSISYISERIQKGIALGIYEDHRLVAWIITHDDGAMGFLTVLPDYQRKRYGYELSIAMIKRLREAGNIPFVHIEADNDPSMRLALKLGFIKERQVHWFKRSK